MHYFITFKKVLSTMVIKKPTNYLSFSKDGHVKQIVIATIFISDFITTEGWERGKKLYVN